METFEKRNRERKKREKREEKRERRRERAEIKQQRTADGEARPGEPVSDEAGESSGEEARDGADRIEPRGERESGH